MKIIYIKPCRVSIEYCLKFKEKVIINWVLEENPTRYGISCHCTSNHSIYDLKHHQHFFYKLYSFQGTYYAVFNFHIICVTNHVGVFSVFTKLHLLYQKVLVTSILVWWQYILQSLSRRLIYHVWPMIFLILWFLIGSTRICSKNFLIQRMP